MSHLRNGANDKSISPNYVSDLHDTCITSEKPAQHAFYDHFVAYSQNCCTETVLAEGNGIRGHQKSKRECIDYQHISFIQTSWPPHLVDRSQAALRN